MNDSRNTQIKEAFRSVARCPNVRICLENAPASHPCSQIVTYQKDGYGVDSYDQFQLPEPWTGEIDVAPILFVGSNPSIGEDNHATGASSDDEIWDSHHHVFGGGSKRYTFDGKYTTKPDGTKNLPHVATWAGVRKRAEELIPDRAVVPGIDYALTEVVHCKSRSEIGVASALETCVALHFNSVMGVAAASVIVALGKAREMMRRLYHIPTSTRIAELEVGGKSRIVVFLGHPTGPETRTFQAVYPAELPRLREAVARAQSRPAITTSQG